MGLPHTPTALLDDRGADPSYPSLAYAFAPLYARLAKASELSSVECVEHECTVHCESEQGPRDHYWKSHDPSSHPIFK